MNDSLTDFFRDTSFKIKLNYISAMPALKIFYSNMIYITCIVYGLNHVVEKVRYIFLSINKLVNNGKKMFLKVSHRITDYKNYMDCV